MALAALLLTGGASRRLGTDKATLVVDGRRLVDRVADLLGDACDPVVEVGPAFSALPAVLEDPPGRGPLAAVAAGAEALDRQGYAGATIVLAVDLPRMTAAVVTWLRDHPSPDSVVPVVDGVAQVLCARYSARALAGSRALVAAGARSMHALLDAGPVHRAHDDEWGSVAHASVFADIDTPTDAAAADIDLPR